MSKTIKLSNGTNGKKKESIEGAISKNFPNLDPSFFIPSYAKSSQSYSELPYAVNTWVYAACSAITTNLLQIPWVFDLKGTSEQELITEHPFFQLLKNPNPMMSSSAFIETLMLNLLLPTRSTKGGQCFIIMESGTGKPVSLLRGDIPKEMYPFSDASIKPILRNNQELVGWELEGAKGQKIPYALDEVIRIYLTDPYNPLKGQSPIWAAMQEVRADEKSSRVNERFFDNNASLGGVLHTDNEFQEDEVKMLRKQWEETYGSPENAGKTAVIHSGLRYEQFQRSHVDMQYIEQKKLSREAILAAYRVPKAEVSLYEDINYATAKSADKTFWTKVLLPHLDRILEGFNSAWIQYIDSGKYKLIGDTSNVEALQENFGEKLDQAKTLAELKVPVEEINRRLEMNLMIKDYPWLSTALVPFSLAPAETVMTNEPPEEEEETEDDSVPPETIEESIKRLDKKIEKANSDEKSREEFVENYNRRVIRPSEKLTFKAMTKFFVGQRNRYLDKIDAEFKKHADDPTIVQKIEEAVSADFIKLNAAEEAVTLRKILLPVYRKMITSEAEEMEREIGPFLVWNEQMPGVEKFLKQRLKKIKSINGTSEKKVLRVVKQALQSGIEENLNSTQLAKLLKEEVRKVYNKPFRAKTIARTESGIIHGQTRHSVLVEEGFKKIMWLTAADEKVRSAPKAEFPHNILDGTEASLGPKGEPFFNGETIRFPSDPSASPANVINCRCTFVGIE